MKSLQNYWLSAAKRGEKIFSTQRTLFISGLLGAFFILTAQLGTAHPINMNPPHGTIETITVRFNDLNRPVSLYVPTSYQSGTAVPLLFALHGGSGDASKMYDPETRIVEYAEAQGFIAVFPNGLPRPGAPAGSINYFWEDPVNIPYMNHLIDLLNANYTIDSRRVYFVGFSGGAKLIYGLAADPGISARIAAIATVAGEMGGKLIEPPTSPWEIIDPTISGGVPMSAMLLQGGEDKHMPENGGFDDDFERVVSSFQIKVDVWRLFIGAGRTGANITPADAPQRVVATEYVNGASGNTVVSMVDPVLAHRWPEWNFMGVIWDFFERVPVRATCPMITLNPTSLPRGNMGSIYTQSITASPAGGNYTYAVTSGTLPPGLSLSPNGLLSGTPTANGSFNFTVRATNANGCAGSLNYAIRIRNN
jgi:poly(3-hydroxybutyrate) depolymerase